MNGHGKERIAILTAIMAVTSLAIASISIGILYNVSLGQQKLRLIEMAQSQARMIESVADFDAQYSQRDHPEGAFGATLNQITQAHKNYKGFGETGEFTLAKLGNNRIIFLLSHRHEVAFGKLSQRAPVPMGGRYAQPMQHALKGESGSIIGLDYRGEKVLAAFEPVKWSDHKIGIVSKIDMSEIRAPFIKAGLITTAFSILLIILGSIVFRRVGNPLIKHLEESEERYRKVVEQSPDAILVHANGSIIFANSTTIKMIGVDCQETIIGKNISEFFPNLSWKEEEKRVEDKNFSGLSATVKEEQLLKPDGTAIEVEISSIPFEFKGREGIQTVIHDISERKRAENTMNIVAEGVSRAKTGKEFFKSLVESIGTSLDVAYAFVGELEGNDINTIAVWGDGKVQPNFRYNLEHTPCQVASETNICAYPWDIQKYFPKDRMLIEMSIESYAGARLIDSAGRPIGIIVILDRKPLNNLNMAINMLEIFGTRAAAEIERKKNEESLEKAKEEAEVATLQKDKYIALVTHDLRSPLLTMLGYLGVIKRDSKITKKESTKKAIVQSKKIAGEMLVLIDDILDIGRFKSGTMGINKKFFSAYFISEKVIENHKNLAEEKSVRIVNDVERSSRLYADPALFIEVIKNLVVNAI